MIKKLLGVFMVVLMLTGIFFAIANFTTTNLEAWQHYGTYVDLGPHGWICSGPRLDCVVGGPGPAPPMD